MRKRANLWRNCAFLSLPFKSAIGHFLPLSPDNCCFGRNLRGKWAPGKAWRRTEAIYIGAHINPRATCMDSKEAPAGITLASPHFQAISLPSYSSADYFAAGRGPIFSQGIGGRRTARIWRFSGAIWRKAQQLERGHNWEGGRRLHCAYSKWPFHALHGGGQMKSRE